jgi:protein kinase-like protein/type III secretion system (T3SS) inner membrane Yop/YscD-like protein
MTWRLTVVDGADAKRYFPLPDTGTVVIGNSHKHSDICLHDLLVARVHCQLDVEDDVVTVTALSEDKDTRVDGQKVSMHLLREGEILRVGNSHMRLEPDVPVVEEEAVDADVVEDVEAVDEVAADDTVEADVVETAEAKPAAPPQLEWGVLEKLSGYTLGHFQLGPVLGRGHTGVTFKARDTEARREVALKVIGPAFPAAPQELQQFARVIRKIADIRNENLVTWFAAGRSSRYVWIAQELVEGESLAQVLKRGQSASMILKWRNALKLGIDLAKALDFLFKRRIVHGNLTPGNVLVGTDRNAKLNDLMFEEAMRSSKWHDEQLEEKLLADLPYLAPERLEEGAYWDAASDIYSLGALVYARLTSRPPFEATSPGEMLEAISTGKLVPPREIVRGCPEDFEAVVLKMLAHNQEDRYQSPTQLMQDFDRLNASL